MGSSTLFQIEFCQNINPPISLTSVENWENYLLKYLNIHTSIYIPLCLILYACLYFQLEVLNAKSGKSITVLKDVSILHCPCAVLYHALSKIMEP